VWNSSYTTRGLVEEDMETVALIDRVVSHTDEAVIEAVANEVNEMMSEEQFSF
jgi:glycine hydroxymethyltransferase